MQVLVESENRSQEKEDPLFFEDPEPLCASASCACQAPHSVYWNGVLLFYQETPGCSVYPNLHDFALRMTLELGVSVPGNAGLVAMNVVRG